MPEIKFVRCIPHNADAKALEISGFKLNDCSCQFPVREKSLIDKNDSKKYAFDLVISTMQTLPAGLMENGPTVENKPSNKDMFPNKNQVMFKLLKDPRTASVAFVFTIHGCQRKVGLWAHRILLDKYPRFQGLYKAYQEVDEHNDTMDTTPSLIPIEGISLSTFCVLLKYLYTEELDLAVDPTQYVMCDMERLQEKTLTDSTSSFAVLNKTLKEHNTAQFYATWNVKDKVTWSDLFLAADRFEITELRKKCLENLLASVDKDNAMEILFGIGTRFQEEVYDPVMKYISEHLHDFSLHDKDPFKRFADHERCYEKHVGIKLKLLNFRSTYNYPNLKFIHILPRNAVGGAGAKVLKISDHEIPNAKSLLMGGGCSLDKEFIINKDDPSHYAFNLALSTSEDKIGNITTSSTSDVPEYRPSNSQPFRAMFPDKHGDMLRLLKDPKSVNTGFLFTIRSCQGKIALWTHSSLLEKYPRFQDLFEKVYSRLALIPIEGISLATFCVLLKYIYTEDLDLNVDSTLFLLCDMDQLQNRTLMDSTFSLGSLNDELKDNAAQFHAVNDRVTWTDIFLAADKFEIADLRKMCLENLLASVDRNSAMDILFGLGPRFKKEIHDPVVKYISDHLNDVFSIRTDDPFQRYAHHEGYHEVMLELVRVLSCLN
ncbi:hypothetical protein BGZ65_012469 [Modicella reniformis]|uniref:BTB domain-containing protein n=1 Tax=Modicella reniformis TaxID=1440133 RepID=A0A9P6MJT0_9FUNG|nr:hypothetical protein BGZ65_012469 [Modicella reniformis]